jgi:hypothetical protein
MHKRSDWPTIDAYRRSRHLSIREVARLLNTPEATARYHNLRPLNGSTFRRDLLADLDWSLSQPHNASRVKPKWFEIGKKQLKRVDKARLKYGQQILVYRWLPVIEKDNVRLGPRVRAKIASLTPFLNARVLCLYRIRSASYARLASIDRYDEGMELLDVFVPTFEKGDLTLDSSNSNYYIP